MGKGHGIWNSVRDYAVLAGLLAAANGLLSGNDPGWLRLNPTPWLLPGLLLGARYGFASGLISALVTSALIAVVNQRISGVDFHGLLKERGYFFFSIVAAGAVAGELRAILRRRSASLAASKAMLDDENDRLKSQLELTRQARHEIQRQLALYNAPLAALDDDLKNLFIHSADELPRELLTLLHRLTRVTSAGIYVVNGPQLEQCAVLHPTPPLAKTLALAETPFAEKAHDSGQLVSVPDALALTPSQPFLAALPWLDPLERPAVLLIQDMPLEAFTLHNLAKVELVLTWTAAILRLRQTFQPPSGRKHTLGKEEFTAILARALQAERIHALPSAVLRLATESPEQVRIALKNLPSTAITAKLEKEHALAVLLPFCGDNEAIQLTRHLSAAIPGLRSHHYLTGEPATAELLWKQLQEL